MRSWNWGNQEWGLELKIEIGDWELRLGMKDEIYTIYTKLGYSFYYASSMVVWLLDYRKISTNIDKPHF